MGTATRTGIAGWLIGNTAEAMLEQLQCFVLAAEGDAAKGKPIFETTCVPCHGPQGKGDGPIGQQLKPPAANFTNPESKKKSPAELLDTIQNGRPGTGMVAWKIQFSETQMQDLLAYVLHLRK